MEEGARVCVPKSENSRRLWTIAASATPLSLPGRAREQKAFQPGFVHSLEVPLPGVLGNKSQHALVGHAPLAIGGEPALGEPFGNGRFGSAEELGQVTLSIAFAQTQASADLLRLALDGVVAAPDTRNSAEMAADLGYPSSLASRESSRDRSRRSVWS
jgi:hypothetical protein